MTRDLTIDEFRKDLDRYMNEVSGDATLRIERDGRSVVVLSEEEYEGWKETMHLLQSPANAEDLLKAIAEANMNKLREHGLIEE